MLLSPDQTSRGAIPVSEVGRDKKPQQQYQTEVRKYGHERGWMWQTLGRRVSKDHRLHTTEDRRKHHAERQQQNGRCPGLLFHGGRQNEEFTREHAKRGRAEN